ncbi:MAG TPA: 4-(cytidine 5'-diphospho)-2-C-methyl-D-erythritol kinase [Bacteroidales bacterium]|nr:4-(cytidine 5'-diphospho)-2-C-methyl-D-erythritol kinase [Bacteroidales bacterium]HOF06694.1 4-(cytidine 5'-diphospho)-2-C-methyl-D-erythritol kinase [Bacteroidales bacterium]HON97624.1 4-(cytidine 5'-diphospho)-2-C-methyl-D-erythritol kinase [Bacteroidales bacterium]HOS20316.1 4-(cytidine 5'-diphospho)-2-C-methyl-D-erythritol kinase [Bacteroidales bacterium]HQE78331.1 4-(cytidine 5'-diphospho)-2-C-methyl-D-erythritol kinase [Bacteroidales bacterium]
MTNTIIEKAPAKINLGLFILNKRSDGYHNIYSVFYPLINFYDTIEISLSSPSLYVPNHPELENESNLVWKAYNLLKQDFDLPSISIILNKNIPYQAGLGGGSSDAIATIKAINKLFDLELTKEKLLNYANSLGSDCAFFIDCKPSIVKGRGDIINFIDLSLQDYLIVVFLPIFKGKLIHVSTAEAYNLINTNQDREDMESIINNHPIDEWANYLKNDFLDIFIQKYPFVNEFINTLYDNGALYVNLSGSGSAIFAIYDKKSERPIGSPTISKFSKIIYQGDL